MGLKPGQSYLVLSVIFTEADVCQGSKTSALWTFGVRQLGGAVLGIVGCLSTSQLQPLEALATPPLQSSQSEITSDSAKCTLGAKLTSGEPSICVSFE